MSVERARILGVRVDVVSEADVLRLARASVASRTPSQVVTVNAEFVIRALRDAEFNGVIEQATMATPDGSGIVWALRRQGIRLRDRVGGSDLIWSLSDDARRLGHRLFLLGGAPGVAEATARRLQTAYPGLLIAGTHAGSPAAEEESGIVDLVRRSKTDILFVAYGAPAQEYWLARNLQATGASFGIGMGGSFDYLAGTARRAPIWMRETGVEWLWRLVRQPRRWRRMLALPQFTWLVLRDGGPAGRSSG